MKLAFLKVKRAWIKDKNGIKVKDLNPLEHFVVDKEKETIECLYPFDKEAGEKLVIEYQVAPEMTKDQIDVLLKSDKINFGGKSEEENKLLKETLLNILSNEKDNSQIEEK